MVNRSVAKRAKHAKPALRKGYWAKSSSSVLAVALAASLVPAVPALGDEFDADVSDIEATEPPAFDAPIPTEPSSTAPDAPAELEAGDRATSVDSKSDAGNKGTLPESGGAEGVRDRTFGEVDDAGFREGLGAEALAAAEVQEESSGQGSSTTWVPEGPENSWRYEDGVALGSLAAPGARTASSTTPTWTSSNGATTYTLGGKRVTVSGAKAVGIDVSVHQGSIDWAKVKAAGITFAIIRCGYGSDIEEQDDKCFLQNVEGARKNGIQIGIYLYSYAKKATGSAPSAQSEAEHVLRLLDSDHANLKPSDLALPIYYDLEDDSQLSLTDAQRGQLAETFCNKIQAAGYKVGIYANKTWWEKYLTSPVFNNRSWSRWIAQYPGSAIGAPDVTFSSDLWQFTESGQVSGVSGNCDVNFSFTSFSSTPQEVVLTGTPNTWAWMNGYAYYYGSDGKAVKWSQKIDGKWYYFDGQCRMKTGWVTWSADGSKSYFDGNGRALMEWQTIGGKTYYFNPSNGQSLRGMHVIDGQSYYFNEHSELVGGKSETKTETTGVSLTTLAAKELSACPSALKYTQADIVASMTPTNYGAGTSGYYQFAQLNHGYSGMVSAAQLDAYIASTASGRTGTLAGKGEAFVNAARRYGVNEVYLLAHAILESGWGTSTLAKGYVYDGKTLVDGKTWPKGTYYNFYGIGAYDSSPLSGGRALAIKNGWDTPEKAIDGAARWIATNYLNNAFSQNTLYKMRWNYVEYARYGSVCHQYATDRDWATKIGSLMNAIYASASVGQAQTGLTFLVPSYR